MKKAFTLIELLVVIAIIAILAAILFPVFAQAKAAAKKSADLSNHKQIITSIILYASDNDDATCHTHHDLAPPETENDLYVWFDPLQPYIKNKDVFRDSVVSSNPSLFPDLVTINAWTRWRTDYLINGFYSHGASLGLMSRPAEQIIIAERHAGVAFWDYHPWPTDANDNWERGLVDGSGYQLDPNTGDMILDPLNVGRHTRGNNYSFVDGHAKWFKFNQTLDKTMDEHDVYNYGMHNIDNLPPNE